MTLSDILSIYLSIYVSLYSMYLSPSQKKQRKKNKQTGSPPMTMVPGVTHNNFFDNKSVRQDAHQLVIEQLKSPQPSGQILMPDKRSQIKIAPFP